MRPTMWWDKRRCTERCSPESRWSFCSPTFWCDSEHGVWWWRPVNIRGVPDRAGVGSIIAERCVYQRDGSVAASRGTMPPDTAKELTRRGEENPWGEVEKLEREERFKKIIYKVSLITPFQLRRFIHLSIQILIKLNNPSGEGERAALYTQLWCLFTHSLNIPTTQGCGFTIKSHSWGWLVHFDESVKEDSSRRYKKLSTLKSFKCCILKRQKTRTSMTLTLTRMIRLIHSRSNTCMKESK